MKTDWKGSGYSLKFYHDERQEFKEQFEKKLNYQQSEIIIAKIIRHCKLDKWSVRIKRTDRIGAGKCFTNGLIKLRYDTSIGIICHEFAHLISYRKYYVMAHDKKMRRMMKSLMNYCKKKNYWEGEIKIRTAPRMITLPTESESRLIKIKKKQEALLRYEKKLKYYTKLYNTKIKKAKRSIAMLERSNRQALDKGSVPSIEPANDAMTTPTPDNLIGTLI
mgnify:CR=1 FL=1